MEATLTEATRPAVLAAAEHLAAIVREPGPGAERDVGHLELADVEALAEQLRQSGTVEAEPAALEYAVKDALANLADRLVPTGADLEAVAVDALTIAALALEARRLETENGRN